MKKKLTLIACALIAVASLMAQDIIVTMDAQKIEAKILEVSKTEIKYKEKDNLNGPTFILDTKEISSIIYSNGKVVVYNQEASVLVNKESEEKPAQLSKQIEAQQIAAAPTVDEKTIEILLLSGNTIVAQLVEMKPNYVSCVLNGKNEVILASQIEKVTLLANGQVKEYNGKGTIVVEGTKTTSEQAISASSTSASKSGRIYRDNGHYLHNDTYISSREVERLLEKESSEAYEKWRKADGMAIGGAVCSGVGLGLALGSIFPFLYAGKTNNISEIYRWSVAGVVLATTGGVSAIVGVGLLIGASAQYNKAIYIYNSNYDHAAVQLQWHVAPTEVGLALVF